MKVSVLLRMSLRKASKSRKYVFLQYVEKSNLIVIIDNTIKFFLLCNADVEMNHGLPKDTCASAHKTLNVKELFGLETLQSLHSFFNVIRANDAISSFLLKIPCPLRRIYRNRFCSDCNISN